MKTIVLFVIGVLVLGCTGPGVLTGEKYLMAVSGEKNTTVTYLDSFDEVNKAFNDLGIEINSRVLMGEADPFFEFRNSELFIYVEKKSVYIKNGKDKIKVYDEELE